MNDRPTNYFKEHIRDSKAVAYCHSKTHKGRLTVRMMKQHNCLQKQCSMLEKYEDHDYWRQREVIKARKKAKKDANKDRQNQQTE